MIKKVFKQLKIGINNKIFRKVCRYTSNVIIAVLVVLVVVSVYGNIQAKGRDWVVPTVGSCRWLTVLSGSMKPTFNPGDLIVDKKVDPNTLKVGDVVTYMFGGNFLSTHRIIEVNKDDKGKPTFKTKGDNNKSPDENVIPGNMIVGKYLFRIPFVGFALQKLKGLPGLIGIWILFFYVVVTEIYKSNKESKKKKIEETTV